MREAIVLVGGQGTRLRPLTDTTAKPLLPVAGVPFLAHQLSRVAEVGVEHVVLATSYRAETFAAAFGSRAYGVDLDYAVEEVALGTGGAIRHAAALLRCGPDDPVLVLNGDVLSGHDLAAQLALHRARAADVTLHLTRVEDPRAFGCVPTDAEGRVTAFLEKTPEPVTDQVNGGCYVFRRGVIDEIPAGAVVSVERDTYPALLSVGSPMLGYVEQAYWLDVGTPAALVQASADLVRGVLHSAAVPAHDGDRLLLAGACVGAEAQVDAGSVVGRGARVADGARVSGSVLRDAALVAEGAVVVASVLGVGARVGSGAVVRGAVLGDGCDVGAGNELVPGARVQTGARLDERVLSFHA